MRRDYNTSTRSSSISKRDYTPSSRSRSKGPLLRIFILAFIFSFTGFTVIFILHQVFKKDGLIDTITTPKTVTIKTPYVPTTSFNDPVQNISASDIENYELVAINNLTPSRKVLSINNEYFLDHLDADLNNAEDNDIVAGAVIKTKTLPTDSEELDDYPEIKSDQILKINQTGVTALTRAMQNKLNQVGDATFFSEKIADFLKAADLTHISNEVSFADNCNNQANMRLCASPKMYDVITAIGTDIVELTGNHNNDWGTTANISTINKYHDDGIKTFGGGLTEKDAQAPLEISEKDTNITWIGINHSTSSKANGEGANGDNPGANIYDAADTISRIKSAKEKGDFVIVDVQFAECYCYPDEGAEMPECDSPITGQAEFFQSLADAGADLVVGTQAHQPQTYELYNNTPIYYGLGNLFFDQTYWPGTMRSLVLTHYFYNGKLLQTKITPTTYDANYQTSVMTTNEAEALLTRLNN